MARFDRCGEIIPNAVSEPGPPGRVNAQQSVPSRTKWIDIARGLGIILVVWGHVIRANIDLGSNPLMMEEDRWLYSFHMPLFFVLAGLFLWPNIEKGRIRFLRNRWLAIIWPYILWSLILGIVEIAATRYVNSPMNVVDLLRIPFAPIEQFWFLYALLICQLVCVMAFPSIWRLWLLSAAGIILLFTIGGDWIGIRAMTYLPFVAVGVTAAHSFDALSRSSKLARFGVSASGWALLAIVLVFVPSPASSLPFKIIAGLGGSVGCIGIATLLSRWKNPLADALSLLGQASLVIYILHTLFSAGARIALKLVGVPASDPMNVGLSFFAGLFIPWGCHFFLKDRRLAQTLGFGA